MIRRLFWLLLGAVLGVTGYRRAVAFARSLRPAPGALPGAEGLAAFTADVREGMAIYMERQSARAPSTLEGHGAHPGERSASAGASSRTPRPGTPRWPQGPRDSVTGPLAARLARRTGPSRTDRTDELKDGR